MKRLLFILFAIASFTISVNGQELEIPDTLVQEIVTPDRGVFEALDGQIVSSDSLNTLMKEYKANNPDRNVQVYRLRIFFDNHQEARANSEQVVLQFRELYPGVPVFRGYSNPYFKVTVGNFRSKSEAMRFLNEIKGQYPSVFLVKETFSTNEA